MRILAATRCSFLLVLTAAGIAHAQLHLPGAGKTSNSPKSPTATTVPPANTTAAQDSPRFDYYVFALAWAQTRFSVLGLLPLAVNGASPESCEAKPVSKGVFSLIRPVMPDKQLVRREWEKHGSCTGLSAADYFTDVLLARSLVQIPVQLTSFDSVATATPESIEAQFAGANPGFPAGAFRTACDQRQLTEVRVCFDLLLKPRECPVTAGECAVPVISFRPARYQ